MGLLWGTLNVLGIHILQLQHACRCPTNSCGEKILSDGTVWLPALWEAVRTQSLHARIAALLHVHIQHLPYNVSPIFRSTSYNYLQVYGAVIV